jgi:hypothetical protein
MEPVPLSSELLVSLLHIIDFPSDIRHHVGIKHVEKSGATSSISCVGDGVLCTQLTLPERSSSRPLSPTSSRSSPRLAFFVTTPK